MRTSFKLKKKSDCVLSGSSPNSKMWKVCCTDITLNAIRNSWRVKSLLELENYFIKYCKLYVTNRKMLSDHFSMLCMNLNWHFMDTKCSVVENFFIFWTINDNPTLSFRYPFYWAVAMNLFFIDTANKFMGSFLCYHLWHIY